MKGFVRFTLLINNHGQNLDHCHDTVTLQFQQSSNNMPVQWLCIMLLYSFIKL